MLVTILDVAYAPPPNRAGVAELADALDLGSSAARRRGSSPLSRSWIGKVMADRYESSQPLRYMNRSSPNVVANIRPTANR